MTVICGDVREELAKMDTGSVQCVVTSPPYWGLRDYGLPPLVWGGDEACAHEWGDELVTAANGGQQDYSSSGLRRDGRTEEQRLATRDRSQPRGIAPSTGSAFCLGCAAWRGCLGLEPTPERYVAHLVTVFHEVRRVLRNDGTLWLNLGDSYSGYHGNSRVPDADAPSNKPGYVENMRATTVGVSGLKPKDLVGIPWRVAFALQADGWWLRSDIIWAKPNPMPESVTDRPTKAHEYLFLLTKAERYYYDAEAIKEQATYQVGAERQPSGDYSEGSGRNDGGLHRSGGFVTGLHRNRRSVWTIATQPFRGAHFATFPYKLVEPCVLAGSRPGDTVLDPFAGSGTVVVMAEHLGRVGVGIELNPAYVSMVDQRRAHLAKWVARP